MVKYQVTVRADANHPAARFLEGKNPPLGQIVLYGDLMILGGATVSTEERVQFFPKKGEGDGISLTARINISNANIPFVSNALLNDELGGISRTLHVVDCFIVVSRHVYGAGLGHENERPADIKQLGKTDESKTEAPPRKSASKNRAAIAQVF